MAIHVLDIPGFRAMFPGAFPDPPYTDDVITAYWEIATCAIDTVDNCSLHGDCLQSVLNLMTAHIMTLLGGNMMNGRPAPVGTKTSATIDKVSVAYAPPPFKSGWQAWLAQTQYGLMLWAILQGKSAGGFYFGGMPEGDAFRKAYGVF